MLSFHNRIKKDKIKELGVIFPKENQVYYLSNSESQCFKSFSVQENNIIIMKGFEIFKSLDELDTESKYLIHKAKEAAHHAYAPYSKFHVGAALILEDGTLVTGSNQENASYPLCMCAERVALYAAVSQHPDKKIMKIAIVAHKKNHKELSAAASCGACRQVMTEFEERQSAPIEVIMHHTDSQWIKCPTASSLLPFVFEKSSFKE